MNEINNKRNKLLFVLGIIALLLVVIGATYAYFAVSTINNFGTSIINAQAGNIGTVTLNGNSAQLNLSVTALDMAQGNGDITYYASSSGKTTTPTEETIGTASVTPSTDTNYYHCTYTLSVTHTGTTDMYTTFSSAANKSAGQIILTINGTDYDFNDGWPTNNQVTGSFNTTVSNPANITAGLRIINKSSVNQNYLANTDIQISISLVNNSLSCTPESYIARMGTDSSKNLPVVRIGEEEFYDLTNAINYSSLVSTNGNIYNYTSDKSILLAKYNLYVGAIYNTSSNSYTEILSSANGYGLQSSNAKGSGNSGNEKIGVVPFATSSEESGTGTLMYHTYWYSDYPTNNTLYSTYGVMGNHKNNIYDSSYNTALDWSYATNSNYGLYFPSGPNNLNYSIAYYVEEYVDRLGINGTGRLLTYTEANAMTQTQRTNGAGYWLGSTSSTNCVDDVYSDGYIDFDMIPFAYAINYGAGNGVRPVIVINTSDIGS